MRVGGDRQRVRGLNLASPRSLARPHECVSAPALFAPALPCPALPWLDCDCDCDCVVTGRMANRIESTGIPIGQGNQARQEGGHCAPTNRNNTQTRRKRKRKRRKKQKRRRHREGKQIRRDRFCRSTLSVACVRMDQTLTGLKKPTI